MGNLTATISAPRYRKAGCQPMVYDCGRFGRLTREQIARQAGITPGAVWHRLNKLKISGEALLDGTGKLRRRTTSRVRMPSALIACKLAYAFPASAPTWREVQAVAPMCEQAAKRWSRAIRQAIPATQQETPP